MVGLGRQDLRRYALVFLAVVVLPGCAQGTGDWPTLASAIGWGEERESAVPAPPAEPVRVAAARGAPTLTDWDQTPESTSYSASSYSAPVAPYVAAPPPPPVGAMQGSDLVAQAFAQGFAATAPTITNVNMATVFAAPGGGALSTDLSGIVPRGVLDTYNDALSGSAIGGGGAAGTQLQSQAQAGFQAGFQADYLDPTVIQFQSGSSRLSSGDKRRISTLVRNYKSRGGIVNVVGHASSRTGDMDKAKHDMLNFEISFDRANAVTGELMRQGVAPDHVIMEARADRDPIYYEYMPAGEAGNQRVEIFLQ